MHPLPGQGPREQHLVALADPAARIDDHEQALERTALTQRLEQERPGAALGLRRARVPVSRQIDDPRERRELEEVDEPCAPRCLAGPRQPLAPDDRIDGARLAGIGAPREGDFRAVVGGKLPWSGGADQKSCVRECGHGRSVQSGAFASLADTRGKSETMAKRAPLATASAVLLSAVAAAALAAGPAT